MDKELKEWLNRLEGKVDTLGVEVNETKETVAYLRGRIDGRIEKQNPGGNGNGNSKAIKYLAETIRLLVVAFLTAFGYKYIGK